MTDENCQALISSINIHMKNTIIESFVRLIVFLDMTDDGFREIVSLEESIEGASISPRLNESL